jgi:subtilisin family serine protease
MKRSLPLFFAVLLCADIARSQEPARYLIGFKPRVAAAQRDQALARLGADPVEAFDELDLVVAEVPDGARVQALSDSELSTLQISLIEEDISTNWLAAGELSFQATPLPAWGQVRAAIPRFQRAQAPVNALPPGVEAAEVPWGIRRVNAPAAWAVTQGEGARVAVIDTGIDAGHPDLAGRVAGGYNAIDGGKPWFDDNVHGTHVSGTIAGSRDGRGVVGVAPQATLFAVKVLDKAGSGRISSIIKGLVWCARNDIHVANMSLGSPVGSVFLRLAIKYASSKGVAIVAAAGNSGGSVGYPASYPETIVVSASDSQDQLAFFSSRGPRVDFIAPGVDVYSTEPGGHFGSHSGTSMATPHVSGLAALAVARGARGVNGVRPVLVRAARAIGLRPVEQGRGMIDAAEVVR